MYHIKYIDFTYVFEWNLNFCYLEWIQFSAPFKSAYKAFCVPTFNNVLDLANDFNHQRCLREYTTNIIHLHYLVFH